MPTLGCIADDFTGATDLASQLVASGMSTIQMIGIPDIELADSITGADAVIIALKSRNIPVQEAISDSVNALRWLKEIGCNQFYFKYCSTFDSTSEGNIGPVTDALMVELKTCFTVVCPALPSNERTVYNGYLFADGVLLNESGMQNHPLTPMTDPNLLRIMSAQTQHNVGLVNHNTIQKGADAVRQRFKELQDQEKSIAILDCIDNDELSILGKACKNLSLVTAGSGLGLGLGAEWQKEVKRIDSATLPPVEGRELILSGSCSCATRNQIAQAKNKYYSIYLDVLELACSYKKTIQDIINKFSENSKSGPILIYASSTPDMVEKIQQKLGQEYAGTLIETAMGEIAKLLVEKEGVRRLIVAGGETSGAVVHSLSIKGLRIGPTIDPGVPWTVTIGNDKNLALALKSGNFGSNDFMTKAWELMP